MRQFKNKFKMKKINKNKRRIKNRMFPVLLSLLIISTTYGTTQAYFNSKADFSKLFGSNEDSGNLKVTNGNVNLEFSNENMAWTTTSSKGITNDGKGTYVCSDLENKNTFKYGPVKLTSASNLTTNVNLSLDFDLRAVQTSDLPSDGEEGSSTINSSNLVPGFEVIVGDIDNFGYGFEKNQNVGTNAFVDFQAATKKSGSYYDVYNDYKTLFNRSFGSGTNASDGGGCPVTTTYSRSHNGISIFPSTDYDASGTDRRMVNTGFYNYLKSKNVINSNNRANMPSDNGVAFGNAEKNDNGSYCTFDYTTEKSNKFYVNGATYYWMFFNGNGGSDRTRVVYDGYTDRALKGFYGVWYQGTLDSYDQLSGAHNSSGNYTAYGKTYNVYWGNWIGEEDNHIDGADNWKYIQPVQALTFKYAKVPDKGKIQSLCIQVYIDDIQPKHQDRKDNSSFSYVSQNQYQVLISGDGKNYKEIPTWSKIINNLSQSGPSGQMVTLNLSDLTSTEVNDVINELKNGSGLNGNGLKFKIDDTVKRRDITDGTYKNRLGLGNYNGKAASGDSYAIDFAKMTVNGNIDATETKMKISGTVLDSTTDTPLEGVTVMTSNSAQTTTDSNGHFELNAIKEKTQITFIKNGYKTYTAEIDGDQTEYEMEIKMQKLAQTVDPDKVNLTIRVEEYPTSNAITDESGLRTTVSDLNGGGDLTQGDVSTSKKGNVEVKQYSKAMPSNNKCLITETTYKDIDLLQLSATQAQCTVNVNPGSEYKVYYVLEMTSISGCYSYEFTSSIRAKSTQENNPGWNVIGTGNKYSSSYNIIGDEIVYERNDSGSDSGSGGSSSSGNGSDTNKNGIDNILKNNTPEIYFQNARSWSTPKIRINNKNNSTVYNTTSGTQVSEATTWYKWTLDNKEQLPTGSQVVVTSNDGTKSSGNLYYFNTKKVFICTE